MGVGQIERVFAARSRAAPAESLRSVIDRLDRWGSDREWRGSDPYEGLSASRLSGLKRRPLGRRLLIQLVKRSPVDLRAVLGIRPAENAAAHAHVLSAHSRIELDAQERADRIGGLVKRLRLLRIEAYPEPCWGYHFDVETRFFFYSSATPNTIATAFVGLALVDSYRASDDPSLLELAEGAGDFLLRRVPRTEADGGAYFGYLPGDRTPIHNANLLAAALLADLGELVGRPDFTAAARQAVEYTVAHQRPDGSWPYAESPLGPWVDGFHTGYVLDALLRCWRALGDTRIRDAYGYGLSFYAERLFLDDGTPKFRADSVYPIDAQCVAQGIKTFSLASEVDAAWLERAWRVYRFAVRRMLRRDGAFIFQRRRLWVNRAPHMRWVEAPMLDALAYLSAAARGAAT